VLPVYPIAASTFRVFAELSLQKLGRELAMTGLPLSIQNGEMRGALLR
jgi:hypothetical protein